MLNPAFCIFLVYGLVALVFTAVLVQRLLLCSSSSYKERLGSAHGWRFMLVWSRLGLIVLSYGTMCDNFRQFLASFNFWPEEVINGISKS